MTSVLNKSFVDFYHDIVLSPRFQVAQKNIAYSLNVGFGGYSLSDRSWPIAEV